MFKLPPCKHTQATNVHTVAYNFAGPNTHVLVSVGVVDGTFVLLNARELHSGVKYHVINYMKEVMKTQLPGANYSFYSNSSVFLKHVDTFVRGARCVSIGELNVVELETMQKWKIGLSDFVEAEAIVALNNPEQDNKRMLSVFYTACNLCDI